MEKVRDAEREALVMRVQAAIGDCAAPVDAKEHVAAVLRLIQNEWPNRPAVK